MTFQHKGKRVEIREHMFPAELVATILSALPICLPCLTLAGINRMRQILSDWLNPLFFFIILLQK